MTRRFTAGVATGILMMGLIGFAAITIHTPATAAITGAAAAPSATATASPGSPESGLTDQKSGRIVRLNDTLGKGLLGKGCSMQLNPLSESKAIVTVVAVSGQTITATVGGGPAIVAKAALGGISTFIGKPGMGMTIDSAPTMTVTIAVSSTTTITRAEQAASLSDIQPDSTLAVQGQRTGDTAFAASSIEILLPTQTGVVTAINGTTATMTSFDARVYTVALGNTTIYRRVDHAAAQTDLAVGSLIDVEGPLNAATSTINAALVRIHLPQVAGPVVTINGNDLTLQAGDNTTTTVHLTDATTYQAGKQETASRSSIVTSTIVIATGMQNSDGSLTALSVNVIPLPTPGDMPSITKMPGFGMGRASFGSSFGADMRPNVTFAKALGTAGTGPSLTMGDQSQQIVVQTNGADGMSFTCGK